MTAEVALQYDGSDDTYYIIVDDDEIGPLSRQECEAVDDCLSAHF